MITFFSEGLISAHLRYHARHARPVEIVPMGVPGARHVQLEPVTSSPDLDRLYFVADSHGMQYLIMALKLAGADLRSLHLVAGSGVRVPTSDWRKVALQAPKRSLRFAVIVSCMGFGESLALLAALRLFRRHLKRQGLAAVIEIYSNPCSNVIDVFRLGRPRTPCTPLPAPVGRLCTYDTVIDLTGLDWLSKPSLVDSALEALGLESSRVPPAAKRSIVAVPRPPAGAIALSRLIREKNSKIILFSPTAGSPTRSMPYSIISRMAVALGKRKDWVAITVARGVVNQGFMDWSYLSASFGDFVGIASLCDAVLTTDCCTVQIADALGKPAVALFTVQDAIKGAAPYRMTVPLQVGDPSELLRARWSCAPEHVANSEAQWQKLDCDRVVEVLGKLLELSDGQGRHSAGIALIARAIDDADQHPAKHVSQIATYCGVTTEYLCRLFSRLTGQSLGSYIRLRRIEATRVAISVLGCPAKVAGIDAGYAHPSSFSRAYRRTLGMSPAATQLGRKRVER